METMFGPLAYQLPKSFEEVGRLYNFAMSHADPRVDDWFLMGSPLYPIGIIFIYLITVLFCKRWVMRLLYSITVVQYLHTYNIILLTINGLMGTMFLWHIYHAGYNWKCQPVRTDSHHEMSIARLIWFFCLSKIVELLDSIWLILRKKGKSLTFLQVYHHSTIVFACWIGARFVPGGSTALIAMVNCWVHVLMYTYFRIKMLTDGKNMLTYVKKTVTIMQMLQFLATIIHCITALSTSPESCNYPRFILFWLMLYMMSFIILFTHFYCYTYHPSNPRSSKTTSSSKSKGKKHN